MRRGAGDLWRLLHFDFDVNSGGEVEVGKGVDGFVGGFEDVDQAFVGKDLIVIAGVFVGVRRSGDGDEFSMGGERYRADDFGAGGHGVLKYFGGRVVDDAMVIGFELDADAGNGFGGLVGHKLVSSC